MTNDLVTRYFATEGRPAMMACLSSAVDCCARERIERLVVFTGTGEGPHYIVKELLSTDAYRHLQLQIVAVTPPYGRPYKLNPGVEDSPIVRSGIGAAMRSELLALGVTVVAAHLPFKPVHDGHERSSPWARVAEAYGVLGGGFALCVQAVLMACDAGSVESGERVVVAAADTAFVAIASRTEDYLSPTTGLLVEHILCRPMRYNISKQRHQGLDAMWAATEPPQPQPLLLPQRRPSPPPEPPESAAGGDSATSLTEAAAQAVDPPVETPDERRKAPPKAKPKARPKAK